MGRLSLDLSSETEKGIRSVLSHYANIDEFFRSVLQYQRLQLSNEIIQFQSEMIDFEKKYNLSTPEFYQKYKKGEMGDSEDTLLWAGVYEMYLENKNKLSELK
jgi:type VI protein secretion system component Hcp